MKRRIKFVLLIFFSLVFLKLMTTVFLRYLYFPNHPTEYQTCAELGRDGLNVRMTNFCPVQGCVKTCTGKSENISCQTQGGIERCEKRCLGLVLLTPCDRLYAIKLILFSTWSLP